MIGAAIYTTAMFIAAAYFHNGWSVLFVVCAIGQSCATAKRIEQWMEIYPESDER
jgi:hypothetical protein